MCPSVCLCRTTEAAKYGAEPEGPRSVRIASTTCEQSHSIRHRIYIEGLHSTNAAIRQDKNQITSQLVRAGTPLRDRHTYARAAPTVLHAERAVRRPT